MLAWTSITSSPVTALEAHLNRCRVVKWITSSISSADASVAGVVDPEAGASLVVPSEGGVEAAAAPSVDDAVALVVGVSPGLVSGPDSALRAWDGSSATRPNILRFFFFEEYTKV